MPENGQGGVDEVTTAFIFPQTYRNVNAQASLPIPGAAGPSSNLHARWWAKAGVGRCSGCALLDLGETHTIMGSIGLQIASDCGKTVTPVFNLKANMINGEQEEIIGRVKLPIEIAGVTHHMEVAIMNRLCADFLRFIQHRGLPM